MDLGTIAAIITIVGAVFWIISFFYKRIFPRIHQIIHEKIIDFLRRIKDEIEKNEGDNRI